MVGMKIKRSVFNKLKSDLIHDSKRSVKNPKVLLLLGARQVGKTTLMEDLVSATKKNFSKVFSFNLEYPNDLLLFSKSESEILAGLTKKNNSLIVIDEFHYVKNISKIFKSIYDMKKNIQIIASGSSSLEIHKHLKESLVGRQNIIKIYPFNLSEWYKTGYSLNNFIVYGGMPGLIKLNKKNDKIHDLNQIVQSYLMKDIRSLVKEENINAFNHLLFYIAENQGQILPVSNVSREIKLPSKTVEKYLSILEQTYVVYGLHGYAKNLSGELRKSKKFYFYDNGIRNLLVKNFSGLKGRNDMGLLYESHLFLELHKNLKPNMTLNFWRTKYGDEVDFIYTKDKVSIPIECKSSYDKYHKGLMKFIKKYNSPYGIIVNNKLTSIKTHGGVKVVYTKFEEFDPDEVHNF